MATTIIGQSNDSEILWGHYYPFADTAVSGYPSPSVEPDRIYEKPNTEALPPQIPEIKSHDPFERISMTEFMDKQKGKSCS